MSRRQKHQGNMMSIEQSISSGRIAPESKGVGKSACAASSAYPSDADIAWSSSQCNNIHSQSLLGAQGVAERSKAVVRQKSQAGKRWITGVEWKREV